MKKLLILLTALLFLIPARVYAGDVAILEHERQFIEDELTRYYSDVSLAERVGICAVIINRMKNSDYPDTAAGVVESLRIAGEFSSYGNDKPTAKPTDESIRLSHDAVAMALSGADPTEGALNFIKIEKKLRGFGAPPTKESGRLVLGEVEFW